MSVAETLTEARALIDTPEKWRHRSEPRDGRCLCMAIWSTGVDIDDESPVLDALLSAVGLHPVFVVKEATRLSSRRHPLYDWNDAEDRTHAEVLAAFDRAIEAAS